MKIMKKLSAFMLSLIMIVGMVPVMAVKADSSSTAAAITLGDVVWDATRETYTFPNATANFTSDGQKIFCLSVSDGGYFMLTSTVDLGGTGVSIRGIEQSESGSEAVEVVENGKKYSSITVIDRTQKGSSKGTITNTQIQSFIRALKFYRNGIAKDKIQKVTVLGNQVNLEDNMTAMAIDGVVHYYKYVTYASTDTDTWYDAYNKAKSSTFDGMKGYLATITNDDEQKYVYKNCGVTDPHAWIGGARVLDGTFTYDVSTIADNSLNPGGLNGDPYATKWRWVCGPEAGMQFWTTSAGGNLGSAVTDENGNTIYNGWNENGEPNNNYTNYGGTKEQYRQEYALEYGLTVANWNDYSPYNTTRNNTYGIDGYIIEYSPYTTHVEGETPTVITPDTSTIPDVKEIKATTSSFTVAANNESGNKDGITGPTQDTTSSSSNKFVHDIVLDADVDNVTLKPTKENMTIESIKKGTDDITTVDGIVTIKDIQPGDSNKVKVTYEVKDSDGNTYEYIYNITRKTSSFDTSADVTTNGTTPDGSKDNSTINGPTSTIDGGVTKKIYEIVVPNDQTSVEIDTAITGSKTFDTSYGNNGIQSGLTPSATLDGTSTPGKIKVKDLQVGENGTVSVEVVAEDGTTKTIYEYKIIREKNNDTTLDTTIEDKTPADSSDNATIDDSKAPTKETINGTVETVKDIIVRVPYKKTSVTLEPKVKESTSYLDTAYGIKKDKVQASVDGSIATDKKSGTITVKDLECGKENIVSIRVVAEDGSSCIYRYKVTRETGKTNTITPSLPSDSTGTITGPTEDTTKTTDNDKYYTVVLPNGTDKVTMTPDINTGDKVTSITVDGTKIDTIPEDGVYTVTEVTPDKAKDLVYEITDPSGNVTKYHYTISQEKKPEEPKKDTPVDKKDPTITDVTVKTEDNTTTPADVKIDNNNANKTIDISVPSNQTDYTFTPATKDPSFKITEVAKVSGPAEVSTSSDGKSFTAKGLDPKTPTIVKVTVTSSTGDTATYTVTIHRAEEGVTPDISVEMNGGSLDLNSLIPEDVRKNAKEILYHCCAHTVLAIDKDGTVRSIGRSNKYKSSLVHVIVKGQDNKWTDYTIYVKVNGATKKDEYGTLVDYKGLNYEITGEDTCRVSSWKTNYNTKKKNIVIPDTIKANGKTYKVTAIAPGAFMRNSKIVTIKIGKNVQEIGNTSFVGLRKIKKFTISKKNKYLKVAGKSGNKAKMILSKNGKILYSMTNMQGSVTIPKSVKQITEYAGAGNVKMTKLVIPASVKRIDPCAFAHAKKMTYVQFKGKVPEMANNCVVDQMNYKKGKVYVPKKYYKQYKSAFQAASKKRYGIKQFPAMSRLKKK